MSHAPNPSYPANIREFCRRLHARGRTAYQIHSHLKARGVDPLPAESTVHCWVDDEYAEKRRLSSRRFRSPGPRRNFVWELRLDRMRSLREADLSFHAIAKVMNLDCDGLTLTEEQVRRILTGKNSRQTVRHLLYPADALKPKRGRPMKAAA